MTSRRWDAVWDLFWAARDLEPGERDRWLAERCGDDTELRREVSALLVADGGDGPLDRPLPGTATLGSVLADPPERVGPYQVLDQLGVGGMGVVYRAHDPRLRRDVALKLLGTGETHDSRAERQFIAEARAASALDHPNICTVYDVGTDAHGRGYMAMAFYGRGTLADRLKAGPLDQAEAVRLASEIADALECAHEVGLVHRDIKPANIAIGDRGEAKILDFGIAVFLQERAPGTPPRGGTPTFMAPEQVRGTAVDARTDVWAMGLLLYEMLSGRKAFVESDRERLRRAILETDPLPLPPTVGPALAAVVTRALRKEPDARYRSAAEFAEALRAADPHASLRRFQGRPAWLTGTAVAAVLLLAVWAIGLRAPGARADAIAVLPFADLDSAGGTYLADGMTEDILTRLAGIAGLEVRSRTSVMQYRATTKPVSRIGDELDVGYILEGSVRRQGDRVRIVAQLIDVESDDHLWAETYDRSMADLLHIQSEIADEIARALGAHVARGRGIAAGAPSDPSSYDLFLRGRSRYYEGTAESHEAAIALLGAVVQRDPQYALAHAFLARAYAEATAPGFTRQGNRATLDSAQSHAERAIRLDPALPDGYSALGTTYYWRGNNDAAIRQHERALAIDATHTLSLFEFSRIAAAAYRFEEATLWLERALLIDPAIGPIRQIAAARYRFLSLLPEARRHVDAGLRLAPDDASLRWESVILELATGDTAAAERDFLAYLNLTPAEGRDRMRAWFAFLRGDPAAAIPYAERLSRNDPAWYDLRMFGLTFWRAGDRPRADSLLRRAVATMRDNSRSPGGQDWADPLLLAQLYAALGDTGAALGQLEAWVELGGARSWERRLSDPEWDVVRDQPRFRAAVRRSTARLHEAQTRIRSELAAMGIAAPPD